MAGAWVIVRGGYTIQAEEIDGTVTVSTSHDGRPYSKSIQRFDSTARACADMLAGLLVEEILRNED